jgi:hypothetical protein
MKRKIIALIITLFGASMIHMQISYAFLTSLHIIENNAITTAASQPVTPPVTSFQTVVINEIMWMGSSASSADEWIELRNTTHNPIDISGWTIQDLGESFPDNIITIPPSSVIPPNGYYLIANYSQTSASSVLNIVPNYVVNVGLANNGELLIMRNTLFDHIDVANGNNAWLKGSNGTPKKSMQRILPPGDGTNGNNWVDAATSVNLDAGATELATPKAAN